MPRPDQIGPVERDEWMLCMRRALYEQVDDPALSGAILKAFADVAQQLVNAEAGVAHCNPV